MFSVYIVNPGTIHKIPATYTFNNYSLIRCHTDKREKRAKVDISKVVSSITIQGAMKYH